MSVTLDAISEELQELRMLVGNAARITWFRNNVIVNLLPRDYKEGAWNDAQKFDFIDRNWAVRTPVSVWTGKYNGEQVYIMLYATLIGSLSFAVGKVQKVVSLKSIKPMPLRTDPAAALSAVQAALQ